MMMKTRVILYSHEGATFMFNRTRKSSESYRDKKMVVENAATVQEAMILLVYKGFRQGAPFEKTMAAMVAAAQERMKMLVCSQLELGGHKPGTKMYGSNLTNENCIIAHYLERSYCLKYLLHCNHTFKWKNSNYFQLSCHVNVQNTQQKGEHTIHVYTTSKLLNLYAELPNDDKNPNRRARTN